MEVEPKWSPRKYSTLIYAKAHDQIVADDYFAAMERVEQRLEIVPPNHETEYETVNVQESTKVLQLIERLELPELHLEERLDIAGQLRKILGAAHRNALPEKVVTMSIPTNFDLHLPNTSSMFAN